jgi:protein-disulfide isomerase
MKQDQKLIFITFAVISLLFIVGSLFYKNYTSTKMANFTKEHQDLLIRDYSIQIGNDNAKVKLVEFFDPACETCASFYPRIKDLMKTYEGQIQLTLRYTPFHKNSDKVVQILEAARKQDMFFETLELLFKTQEYWVVHHEVQEEIVWKVVEKLWLDIDKLKEEMKNSIYQSRIQQDLEDAKALHVNKTPSYFVNGKPLEKFGYQELVTLIQSEL